jgi:lipoate-protein ligase A
VDIDLCDSLGITIVRRSSAGGSIYTDENQLIFSLISKKPLGKNVEDIFRNVCDSLIRALDDFGITAAFKEPNDVVINGKKISGSAQVKKKNVYLIHGTLILSIDQSIVERVLKRHIPENISSIEQESGIKLDIQDLKDALKNRMADRFNIQFEPGTFTEIENDLIDKLVREKYSTKSWNFKR